MLALVCLWVVTIFRVGRDLNLTPKLPVSHSMEQFLDGAVALLGSPAPVSAKSKPQLYYEQLHHKPALAVRHTSTVLPDIRWPVYDDSMFAPPSDEELQKHRSPSGTYTIGSNPYMVVAYNGSFFGRVWQTHQ